MAKKLLLLLTLSNLFTYLSAQCVSQRYQQRVLNDIQTWSNVTYCSGAESYLNLPYGDLKIDVRAPQNDALTQRPVLIFAFGGAFMVGQKTDTDVVAWCDSLAHYGYVTVALQYRLGMNTGSTASAIRAVYRAVQDMNACIRYLKAEQATYGIDTTNIFLAGESAGAITALHTAFLNQNIDRPQETYYQNFTAPDLGDLDQTGAYQNHPLIPQHIKGVISLWGALYQTQYLTANEQIPLCLIHGTDDNIVYYNTGAPFVGNLPSTFPSLYGSLPIHLRMDSLGLENELHPFPGEGHVFYGVPSLTFPQTLWDTVFTMGHQFLYKQLQFDSPIPTGNTNPLQGNTETYSAAAHPNSQYCWTVSNGTILSSNANQCSVQWVNAGQGTIQVQELNALEVLGNPQSLLVNIQAASSLQNAISLQGVRLFPNPNSGKELHLALESNFPQELQLSLVDVEGKLLWEEKRFCTGKEVLPLNMPTLAKGVYFCVIKTQANELLSLPVEVGEE